MVVSPHVKPYGPIIEIHRGPCKANASVGSRFQSLNPFDDKIFTRNIGNFD
jgi:hypothetical protein